MSDNFKTPRPGTQRYRAVHSGEHYWLTEDRAEPWLMRGDLVPDNAEPALEGLKEDVKQQAFALMRKELAEHAWAQSLLAEKRNFGPEALGQFAIDTASRQQGKLTKEFLLDKYGSRWGTSVKSALAEVSGTTGGYGVPWEIAEPLTADIASNSIFRRFGALSQPMQDQEMQIPVPIVTTTPSSGVPNWWGGITFSWTPEASQVADTEPSFKALDLKLWARGATLTASGPLAQDAPGLSSYLRKAIPLAIAWDEDSSFLQGSGAGQPQGVINANATLTQTRQTTGLIKFADVTGMQSKLLPSSWANAIWVFSPTVAPQFTQLTDGTSRAVFIPVGQHDGKPNNWSLLGRPAIPSDQLPGLGSKGDLLLIDPRWYAIGDYERQNGTLEIAASLHVKFLQNQLVLRVTRRIDGRPLLDNPVTLQDGVTQVSPFVCLV